MTTVEATAFTGKKLAPAVVAQLIVDFQHNLHHHTAHTKTRGEVAGSTKKPWRQKGTGRARVGTKRTPLWRGGGRVFGPTSERNFHHKINQGMISRALNTLLIDKATAGEILILDQPYTGTAQTKNSLQFLQGTLDPKSNLLVIAGAEPALTQAVRNLPYIVIRQADQMNLLDVARARHIILLPQALPQLIDRLK